MYTWYLNYSAGIGVPCLDEDFVAVLVNQQWLGGGAGAHREGRAHVWHVDIAWWGLSGSAETGCA